MPSDSVSFDEQMMRRAIRLAMNGRGHVEPNPMVGCVIVKNGRVIGEGYHQKFGEAHAEPNALANCTESPAGATAYVTLEPCCHTNKKTPPCTPRLIEAKIARVVVGCVDPNPDVDGKGLRQLREAGIEVSGPLLEFQAKQLIAPFLAIVNYHRPYITLKWAQTADGKIGGNSRKRIQISNESSSQVVHQLRSRSDAILIGVATAISDNPLLTVRGVASEKTPLRVVIDTNLQLPLDSQLVRTARESPLLVYTTEQKAQIGRPTYEQNGVQIVAVPIDKNGRLSLPAILKDLGDRRVMHLMVEPGQRLSRAFLDNNLADRVWVIRSSQSLPNTGGSAAPSAPKVLYPSIAQLDLNGDVLSEYLNPASPLFFAPEPSADFVLAKESA